MRTQCDVKYDPQNNSSPSVINPCMCIKHEFFVNESDTNCKAKLQSRDSWYYVWCDKH